MSKLYGLMAEFEGPDALLDAARRVRDRGYVATDAFSPMPIHGLSEAVGFARSKLPWLVFAGGLLGCLSGWALQYWVSTSAYAINVGGKPFNSWPAFVVVMFELTVLFASLTAVIAMFVLNGLPRLHHPVFAAKHFERASVDRFFLCVEASDPKFNMADTRKLLESLHPTEVSEVDD